MARHFVSAAGHRTKKSPCPTLKAPTWTWRLFALGRAAERPRAWKLHFVRSGYAYQTKRCCDNGTYSTDQCQTCLSLLRVFCNDTFCTVVAVEQGCQLVYITDNTMRRISCCCCRISSGSSPILRRRSYSCSVVSLDRSICASGSSSIPCSSA